MAFSAGALTDACLSARTPAASTVVWREAWPEATAARPSSDASGLDEEIARLRSRELQPPIEGADPRRWQGSFSEKRGGRLHGAVDILAPRGTPVRAVDDGWIARRMVTRGGGLSVYQYDASGRIAFGYLHLDRYAQPAEGDRVAAGEVLGYVGTTGNAPRDTPHLHFSISVLDEGDRPSGGTPIDPYLVFREP